MYLNAFAQDAEPLDMTKSDEFQSLLASASDLGIKHPATVRYVSRNVLVNGLRLHLTEWGDPAHQALLLLHGGNQTSHSWDLVSLHLSDRFHIIALDQRGHGDSEWPRDGQATPVDMATDAAAVIAALNLRNPIVMGHSMGGIVTMSLLRDFPGVAQKAVLVDVAPELSPEGTRVIQDFIRGIGEFDSADEFVDRVVSYDPFRTRDHVQRTVRYNLLRRADGKYVSKHDLAHRVLQGRVQSSIAERPTLDDAARFNLPVLLVRGQESNVLTTESAERFVARLPQGRLVTVERCAHNVHSQNTLGFLEAVVPFLTE
ncbi:MAG: alpha/beta hydrolase [Dehalococcoidia bacterium]|nr:alpha/beta hydrolase [Dehalococcoidia bacterium]MCB9484474.1 alpha/beta hydrolase [Thermoflexaceae bacterium]